MRFFISSNIKGNKPLFTVVLLFLLSCVFFWLNSWLLYYFKYGLSYEAMFRYFFTDPEYPEKIALPQLLEDIHVHFFLMAIYFLVLSSIFIHKCMKEHIKYFLITSTFTVGFLDTASGLLIYFISEKFIYLKLFAFYAFQVFTGAMLLMSLKLYLSKEREEPPQRPLLYTLVFIFTTSAPLFVILNFFLFAVKLGYTPSSVAEYYLGNPEKFMRPKSLAGMIEVLSPHLIAMSVYVLTLVHFSFFTNLKRKVFWSATLMVAALLDNLSGPIIKALGEPFALVKIASFLTLNLGMLYLCWVCTRSLLRHRAKEVLLL